MVLDGAASPPLATSKKRISVSLPTTSSKMQLRQYELSYDIPEIPSGSKNKEPIALPSLSGSSQTRYLDSSLLSGQSIRRKAPKPSPEAKGLEARGWQAWLSELFPGYVKDGFAPRHEQLWGWAWEVQPGSTPPPFVAIWARGGAKSTSAEMVCAAWGARGARRYALYISETQEQADDHVQNIAALLEGATVERYYPAMAERMVGKYGNSKGWRVSRLRTASGFTVDAVGLDTAARGVKLEDARPDAMVFDDIDGELDTDAATEKKITVITKKLLPAGSRDLAVLVVQNLVLPNGVVARLARPMSDKGAATFLADRIISGPHPALLNPTFEQREDGKFYLTSGEATWQGQDLAACQRMLARMGLSAFLSECQHEVDEPEGGKFSHLHFRRCKWSEVPDLVRIVVWCDPAVTNTDKSDAHGIQADGLAYDDTIYRLYSWEARTTPRDVLRRALLKAHELRAGSVGVETDQGGDTWESVYREAWRDLVEDPGVPEIDASTAMPQFRSAKAGQGHGPKEHRGDVQLAEYERGRFIHVDGTHTILERALRRFPVKKPYDLVDAGYWSMADLLGLLEEETEEYAEYDDWQPIGAVY